jgi:hypothetical protein
MHVLDGHALEPSGACRRAHLATEEYGDRGRARDPIAQ